MNTPPRRLFSVENRIRPKRPGTATTATQATLKSTGLGTPSACTMVGSGMRIRRRWASEAATTATEIPSVQPMPNRPMARPESTLTTSIVAPLTAPTTPLALARLSGSTRIVTQVDRASARIIASSEPKRMRPANSQNQGRPMSTSTSSGVRMNTTAARR